MFIEMFCVLLLGVIIVAYIVWRTSNPIALSLLGILLLIMSATLFAEGLQIENGGTVIYTNGDVSGVADTYSDRTIANDSVVAFIAWAAFPLGLIAFLWALVEFIEVARTNKEGLRNG